MVTTQTPETEKMIGEASEDEPETVFSKCRNSHQKGLGKIYCTSFNTLLVFIQLCLYISVTFLATHLALKYFISCTILSSGINIFNPMNNGKRKLWHIYILGNFHPCKTSKCHFWGMMRGEGDPPPVKWQPCARLVLPLEMFISSFTCRMTGVRVPVWFTEAM